MNRRLYHLLSSIGMVCAVFLSGLAVPAALAQNAGERYENPSMGIAFDLPDGWAVAAEDTKLIAAAPADIAAVQAGSAPQALAMRIVIGEFNELGITDATQLPDLLARLVPGSDITPPPAEQTTWGNASGYQMVITVAKENLTTRVGLLAIAGGRVAVVRGMAPPAVWDSGAGAQFDTLVQSLEFSLPVRDENYLERVISNDGGVFWHYQSAPPGPPDDWRLVQGGGLTYDMFDILYMAAGPGGVLAINQTTGESIAYMGPWYDGNFVDIGIGPRTRLYLANIADETLNAIMVIDRAGNWARGWGIRGDGDGQFAPNMPRSIAVTTTGEGEVWAVSEGHPTGIRNRLYRFDLFGNLRQTIDLDAVNADLSGIRIALNETTGALYVVGATGNLNVVDLNGQALVTNLAQEILVDQTPVDIAIAPNGNIVLAVPAPGLGGFGFLELSVAGQLLDVFGLPFEREFGEMFRPGEYRQAGGMIIGPDGKVYFAETNPETSYTQVQAFLFSGDGRLPLGDEMVVDPNQPPDVPEADPVLNGGAIAYGETVTGKLNNRYPVHRWTFEGSAGDHVVITMLDASGIGMLDPLVNLVDVDGRIIASNDDVGQLAEAGMSERDVLLEFDLPSDGVYTIEATRFGGRGDYTLTLASGS
ncbi:MAG: hypothetical protein JW966_01875 [Anaerolineae bacterium]|nr:hypothetical protein [Anaerolineae bacterium]